MCFSLIFNPTGEGENYTVLYALHVVKPTSIFPWKGRAEFHLILRVNKIPETRPYEIGIYFPFKTGEGRANVERAIPNTYFEEDKNREYYLGHLFDRGFTKLETVSWVLNFDDASSGAFRGTLEKLYGRQSMKKYMDDVGRTLSTDEEKRWQGSFEGEFEDHEYGTVLWVRFRELLRPGAIVPIKIVFDNAEAVHTLTRFWAGSALVLKYPYGHLEHRLCPKRGGIIQVLYYRFKFFHASHVEFEDGGRMEIRPPFGLGPPTSAEGDKFDMERNTIFLNIGEDPPYELLISWHSRRLQLLLPVATFIVGLLLGVLPFLT